MAAVQQWILGLMRQRVIPDTPPPTFDPRWWYLDTFSGGGTVADHAPDESYHGLTATYGDNANSLLVGGQSVHDDPGIPRFGHFWSLDDSWRFDPDQEARFEVDFTPLAALQETIPGSGPGLPAYPLYNPTYFSVQDSVVGGQILVEFSRQDNYLRMILLANDSEGGTFNIERTVEPEQPGWSEDEFRVVITRNGNEWSMVVNDEYIDGGENPAGFPDLVCDSIAVYPDTCQRGGTHVDGPPLECTSGSVSRVGLWAAEAPPIIYTPFVFSMADGDITSTPDLSSVDEDAMSWTGSYWRVSTENTFGGVTANIPALPAAGFPGTGLEIEMVLDFLADHQTRTDFRLQSANGSGWALAVNPDFFGSVGDYYLQIIHWDNGSGETALVSSSLTVPLGTRTVRAVITTTNVELYLDDVLQTSNGTSYPDINYAGPIRTAELHGTRYGTPFPNEDSRVRSVTVTPIA